MSVCPTRVASRNKSSSRVEAACAEDAAERDKAVDIFVSIQENNLKVQEAMARESILSSRKKREAVMVENKQTQLKILQAKKESYVKQHGKDAYDLRLGNCWIYC